MDRTQPGATPPIDSFSWQHTFYAYLIYRQAPASENHLFDLTQVQHALYGHRDPIDAADHFLQTWPFEVTE